MQLSHSSILEVHLVPHGRAIHFGTDMPVASVDVRFRGQTGKHSLILSLTASDPERLEAWYNASA